VLVTGVNGVINSVKFIRRYDDLYFMRHFWDTW